MSAPLRDRIALVTGASRGIGRAVATALAGAGAHVVLVARSQGALEELDDEIRQRGGTATLVPLDLTDGDGIDRLGAGLFERYGRLDVLVGNAAILGPLSPVPHIDLYSWEQLLAVNVTANWRLIRSMDPLLQQSPAGRAIFLTGHVARHPSAYWGGLGTTKAALEHLALTWAAENAKTGLCVNLVQPGPVATDMFTKAKPGIDQSSMTQPKDIAPQFVAMAGADFTANGHLFRYADGNWTESG